MKKEWGKLAKSKQKTDKALEKSQQQLNYNEAVKAHLNDRQQLAKEDEQIKQDFDDVIKARANHGMLGKPTNKV